MYCKSLSISPDFLFQISKANPVGKSEQILLIQIQVDKGAQKTVRKAAKARKRQYHHMKQ